MDVVQAAWHNVAKGEDVVDLERLKEVFDATRHPRVLDGNMSVGQAKEIVARHFDTVVDGRVSWDEFLQYHVRMSNEVDRSRNVDRDNAFATIVVQQWRLDRDPEAAMQPTNIIPVTLECPSGLKRTRNMDLVWVDPTKPRSLCAFKNTVKTRFARRHLPANVRGYFAFPEEMTEFSVKACVARSAFLSPLSVVWVDEQTGRATGLKEVISQNVELGQMPAELQQIIMPADQALKAFGVVEWIPLEPAYNPSYKKSSESVGIGAQESAEHTLELKKKVYEGNNCGIAWYGHTGKFTDSFNGGPYSFSGLNTATHR